MALQLGALRNALLEAGASPDTADKASEEVAGYEREFTAIRIQMDRGFAALRAEMADMRAELRAENAEMRTELRAENADMRAELRAENAGIRADIKMLKWAQGVNFAIGFAILVKLFIH
jgi:hypothetical protein